HRNAMLRYWTKVDLVQRADAAGGNHAEVGSAVAALCEALHPTLLIEPGGEGRARGARHAHLEFSAAHGHTLADVDLRPLHPGSGDVLPEAAVDELTAELPLPEVKLLASKGVDGLIRPTVVLIVSDCVPDDAAAVAVVRPRSEDVDVSLRKLFDADVLVGSGGVGLRAANRHLEHARLCVNQECSICISHGAGPFWRVMGPIFCSLRWDSF